MREKPQESQQQSRMLGSNTDRINTFERFFKFYIFKMAMEGRKRLKSINIDLNSLKFSSHIGKQS